MKSVGKISGDARRGRREERREGVEREAERGEREAERGERRDDSRQYQTVG